MTLSEVKIAGLIPTKDNHQTIADVIKRSFNYIDTLVVIDDGSKDNSGELAREAGAIVLTHSINRGKGKALLTGFQHLHKEGYTHALCIDADGQHLPEEIPRFKEAIHYDPKAIHLGVRDMSKAPSNSTFGRRFSNFWVWVETGYRVGDSQSGYRAYPIKPIMALNLKGNRYDMEVEVLVKAIWKGIAVRDLSCSVWYPPEEERVSSFRPFYDNLRFSLLHAKLFISRFFWPPRWLVKTPPDPPKLLPQKSVGKLTD